jgi:H+/gluconate symporter-like permease
MNSKCQNRNEETDAVRNSLNYYSDNDKGENDIIGKNKRTKIKKSDYEKIASFLIPVILTVLLEIIKNLITNTLQMKANNDNFTLENTFPMMKIVLYAFGVIVFSLYFSS